MPLQVAKKTVEMERDNIKDNYNILGMDKKKLNGILAQESLLR